MTLSQLNKLLQEINPRLKIRQRGAGDVVGVYGGYGYICRATKGELHMCGYKDETYDLSTGKKMGSIIKKRGRKTILNLLRNWRWITYTQRSKLLWGIK